MLAVNCLHSACHTDQLGQLFAVYIVVTREDVVNHLGWPLGCGRAVWAVQPGELSELSEHRVQR
ncbi:hypothetical protein D3C72_2056800 [compost metagenome]